VWKNRLIQAVLCSFSAGGDERDFQAGGLAGIVHAAKKTTW